MEMQRKGRGEILKTWLNTTGVIVGCLFISISCFVSTDTVKQPTPLYAGSHTHYSDDYAANELFPLEEGKIWHCQGQTAASWITGGNPMFEKNIELSTRVTEGLNGNNMSIFILNVSSANLHNYWPDILQSDKKNIIRPASKSKIVPRVYRFDIKSCQPDGSPELVK